MHCALFESCQRDDVIFLRKGSGEGGGASGAAKYTWVSGVLQLSQQVAGRAGAAGAAGAYRAKLHWVVVGFLYN